MSMHRRAGILCVVLLSVQSPLTAVAGAEEPASAQSHQPAPAQSRQPLPGPPQESPQSGAQAASAELPTEPLEGVAPAAPPAPEPPSAAPSGPVTEAKPPSLSVPIVWKACYELENNARDILKQSKQLMPRKDRLNLYVANINYYLSSLQQEVEGSPPPHWGTVWTEIQTLVKDAAHQYNILSGAVDQVPMGAPMTAADLAKYQAGKWTFRDPAKAIVNDASRLKKLLLVVSSVLGHSPNNPGTARGASGTSGAASTPQPAAADIASNDPAGTAATGAGESIESSSPPKNLASATSGSPPHDAQSSQDSASLPALEQPTGRSSGNPLKGQARRLDARAGTRLVAQTAKKIRASANSLVSELERWNLLWGEPPAGGTSNIRFGGGLTPAQVLTQFYYLPAFSFTMPSYSQFSYRLPPRHKFLAYYTRETGKLINLMNREIEATSFTREQMAVANGPWSEVHNIFSDLVAHYMELYHLVTEYDDERLKKNIREDQLRFSKSVIAIHEDMNRLGSVLSDVNSIVR